MVSRVVTPGVAPNAAWSQRVSNRRFRQATARAAEGGLGWAPRYPSGREALAEIVTAAREPRRLRSRAGVLALAVLGIGSLFVGLWALGAPQSFYDSFPGFGRVWVAVDGPFNEHLVRDVGGLELALAAVAFVALASMALALVRVAAAAQLIFGVPHLLYHLTHLAALAPADAITSIVSLSVPVLAALVVLGASRGSRASTAGPLPARASGREARSVPASTA
jgi:hypothetical protein